MDRACTRIGEKRTTALNMDQSAFAGNGTGPALLSPMMDLEFTGTVHTATLAVCTVLVIFVLFLGSFGNGTVLVSAIRCKKLRSNFDLLILNLAGTDFILCTGLSPVFLYLLFSDPPSPKLFCGSFLFLGSLCGMLSLLTIVAIAIHRQARVVGQAKGTLTPTQTAVILGIVWLLSLATALGGTLHVSLNWKDTYRNCQVVINSHDLRTHNYILFFISPIVLVSFIIIIVSYVIIGKAVQGQSRTRVKAPPIYKGPRPPVDKKQHDVAKDRLKRPLTGRHCPCCGGQTFVDKENKAVTMCLVVILTILLCWTPLIVSQFVELLTGETIILYQVKLCGIALVFLNSALDPYIYAQHNGRMKQRYGRLFLDVIRCQGRRRPTRTRLRALMANDIATHKHNKLSQNDIHTNTLHLVSPKQQKRLLNKCVGPGNTTEQKTYASNILLFTASHGRLDKTAGGGLSLKRNNQVGDLQSVMHDVRTFVNKSCCHAKNAEDQSLIES